MVEILITEDSKRMNCLTSRKCRASKIKVIGGEGCGGTGPYFSSITYNKGETIESEFNDDIREDCTEGIHFFLTYDEAKEF